MVYHPQVAEIVESRRRLLWNEVAQVLVERCAAVIRAGRFYSRPLYWGDEQKLNISGLVQESIERLLADSATLERAEWTLLIAEYQKMLPLGTLPEKGIKISHPGHTEALVVIGDRLAAHGPWEGVKLKVRDSYSFTLLVFLALIHYSK